MFSSMLSLLGSLRRGNFVQNSLRFRSSASAYLSRTPSVAGSQTTWTWSGWVKRGSLSTSQVLIGAGSSTSNEFLVYFDTTDNLHVFQSSAGTVVLDKKTTQVFRDPSAWYHVAVTLNSTLTTAEDRAQIWINGSRVTLWATNTIFNQNTTTFWNANTAHAICNRTSAPASYFDGYLTEVNFIDGQALTPSSFGQIESTTGVWSPKPYAGSYGTNGFYLKFGNTSSVAALGTDSSGNGNTWTVNNVSLTAGATYDSMIDVPVNYSDGGNGRGNYAVLNPLVQRDSGYTTSITDANLATSITYVSGANMVTIPTTISTPNSGKWYFEVTANSTHTVGAITGIGISTMATTPISAQLPQNSYIYVGFNGNKASNTGTPATAAYGATYTTNDVIGVAVDLDAGTLTFYKNNASQGVAYTGITADNYFPIVSSNASGTRSYIINCGQRPFQFPVPTGFRALNTNNLPTPSIVNGANFMAATTYTGNAAARSLSNAVNNVSFQPDLVWIKSRTPGATNHALFNSVRLATKYLSSNTAGAEVTNANTLTAFGADGFSLGTDTTLVNASANSYVAWQWKRAVSSGLDIVTYAGTLSTGGTVAINHNLGVAPKLVISKSLTPSGSDGGNWFVWHSSAGTDNFLRLNTPDPAASISGGGGGTMIAPTNSVFYTPYISGSNVTGNNYIAYCFSEISGFSKFSSYIGNGSTDGPFVFCGFKPRWIMLKSTSANNWFIYDTSRGLINVLDDTDELYPNLSNAEPTTAAANRLDILSNGFKVRAGSGINPNFSGQTYIFAAFAEVPSKYALAR